MLVPKNQAHGLMEVIFFKKKTKRLFILIYFFLKKKSYLHDIFNHLSHQTKLMTNDSNNILRFTVFAKKIMRFK
jgi:hypothetical protein